MHHHDFEHIADGVVGAAAIASTILANPLLRAFYRKWGATEHEAHRLLPGDELIASPRMQYTRAISIKAPPEQVWPWLIQIGYGRAGWYSYDLLEDAVGAGEFVDGGESANRIVPELQRIAVGDPIRLHEQLAYHVHELTPPRRLILADLRGGETHASSSRGSAPEFDSRSDPRPEEFMISTWSFILEDPEDQELPEFEGGTRLLIRWRIDYTPTRANEVMWKMFVEPINFVMERRMMLGIKARAEAAQARHG